jgi:2-methylcitrate dehydratase PrpD
MPGKFTLTDDDRLYIVDNTKIKGSPKPYLNPGEAAMLEPTVSGQLGAFLSRLSYNDLSKTQVSKLKIYFLDWLGSAIAGKVGEPVRIILEVIHDLGGTPESTIIADQTSGNCLLAAFANGASSHMVEMDDLHRESILHPATVVIPAVFALAEREKASGADLLLAIAVGYEAAIRVAIGAGPAHYRFWHTTATCGTFGAAAGAARLLGLSEEQTISAYGSSGTQAAGLWEFLTDNAMSKQLHPGKAALNGLLSALLAQKGFTGARKILDGEKGFFQATSSQADGAKCLADLGKEFYFERNSLKYHASCGHTHSAIDAVLQATRGVALEPEEIERVRVSVYQGSLDLLAHIEPTTPYFAKFCLPFCVASALRFGHANLADFSAERIADPAMIRMRAKIRIQSDPELSAMYPRKWPARIEIVKRSGERLTGAADHPKGDPENPLSESEVVAKFKSLTRGLISDDWADALCNRVLSMERIPDVSTLLIR